MGGHPPKAVHGLGREIFRGKTASSWQGNGGRHGEKAVPKARRLGLNACRAALIRGKVKAVPHGGIPGVFGERFPMFTLGGAITGAGRGLAPACRHKHSFKNLKNFFMTGACLPGPNQITAVGNPARHGIRRHFLRLLPHPQAAGQPHP